MIECITIDTFRFLFCHIILAGSFNKLRCCFCCYTFSFLFVYFSFHSFVLFVYKTQYRRFYTLHDRTRHIRVVFMYILDFNCILWVAMPYSWTWTIKTVFIVFVSLSFFFFFWFYVHLCATIILKFFMTIAIEYAEAVTQLFQQTILLINCKIFTQNENHQKYRIELKFK